MMCENTKVRILIGQFFVVLNGAIFQAARTAAQLRFPVQPAGVFPQNHWIAGGHIVCRQ